jgi:hypothetical protein
LEKIVLLLSPVWILVLIVAVLGVVPLLRREKIIMITITIKK